MTFTDDTSIMLNAQSVVESAGIQITGDPLVNFDVELNITGQAVSLWQIIKMSTSSIC